VKSIFEVFVSLRYLKAKTRQSFISLIALLSFGGVALGVTALIVVMSVMNGFRQDIRNKIIGAQSHIMVSSYDKSGIPGWDRLLARIEALPNVQGASPYLANQVLLKSSYRSLGVLLWGMEPSKEEKVSQLKKNLLQGQWNDLAQKPAGPNALSGRGIILGLELSRKLGVLVGDPITVVAPVFKTTAAGTIPKVANLTVKGIFEAGMYEFDSSFAYVTLETAQLLFEQPGMVNSMAVRVKNLEQARETAEKIQTMGNGFWARDFMALNPNLAAALRTEKLVMFVILVLIITVAAFNIASTLIMVVMEKKKDIGILKAVGATRQSIMKIFLFQGAWIGTIGTILGLAGGLGLCWVLEVFPLRIPGGGSVYYIENLPVAVEFWDVVFTVGLAVIMCVCSAIYPAWQASRLDPVEAIRYE
jgi:lipoprotein-releasing system permease protein